jgi:hypothetical protein
LIRRKAALETIGTADVGRTTWGGSRSWIGSTFAVAGLSTTPCASMPGAGNPARRP